MLCYVPVDTENKLLLFTKFILHFYVILYISFFVKLLAHCQQKQHSKMKYKHLVLDEAGKSDSLTNGADTSADVGHQTMSS